MAIERKRLQRSKALLTRLAGENHQWVFFSDKKYFILQQPYCAQNESIYALSSADVPEKLRVVPCNSSVDGVIASIGISYDGKFEPIFAMRASKSKSGLVSRPFFGPLRRKLLWLAFVMGSLFSSFIVRPGTCENNPGNSEGELPRLYRIERLAS
jgi:hypothetical protein